MLSTRFKQAAGRSALSTRSPVLRTCRRVSSVPVTALGMGRQGEPARPVALPGALWLLSPFQDHYYNIHGSDFVIHRGESGSIDSATTSASGPCSHLHRSRKTCRALQPLPAGVQPAPSFPETLHLAVLTDQFAMVLYDITDIIEPVVDVSAETVCMALAVLPPPPPAGIVHQPGEEQEVTVEGVYETSSTSARRTAKMRFLCHRCDAINIKPVNPAAFLRGTVVAQCERCRCKHKIVDHLHVYDDSLLGHAAPSLMSQPRIKEENVPPTLQLGPLRPFYWLDD